jgi:hypothetical protein
LSVLAILASGVAAGAGAAKSPSSLAKLLAADLAKAPTDAQRYRAVLRVMQELRVPVFTAAGKQVVPGGKGLPARFNLYDFELRALAQSLTQTTDVEGFARMLSSGGKHVTAAALTSALKTGTRAAVARPSSQASTVGLLVRELGLRHRPASDLLRVPADRITLDPLQMLLVIADSAVRAGPSASRTPASAGRDGAAPCEGSTAPSGSLLGLGPKLGPGVYGWDTMIAIWLKFASTKLSTISGLPNITHYGPPGHAPSAGRQMRFGVHAEMTVDVPDSLKCGYLRGTSRQFPPKGPSARALVLWFTTGELERYGTVSFDRVTNAKGDAFLTFTPKNEPFPGFGSVKRAVGEIFARSSSSAYIPTSSVKMSWFVEYHRPLGFKFSGLKWKLSLCCDGSDFGIATYEVTHARKCGGDPFANDWAVILHEVADWPGGGGPGYKHDGPVAAHWNPGGQMVFSGPGFGPTPVIKLTQANGQLQASVAGGGPTLTVLNGGPVKVEEDLDNGAFTWSCSEVGS